MYREGRKDAKLCTEEAAFRLHVSPRMLAKYESGETVPPPEVVLAMGREYERPEMAQRYCREHCPIGAAMDYDVLDGVNLDLPSVLLSLRQEAAEAVDRLSLLERLARNKTGRQDFTEEEWAEFTGSVGQWLDLEHNIAMLRLTLGHWCDPAELMAEHSAKCRARGYVRGGCAEGREAA